jgi:hypothetical protein
MYNLDKHKTSFDFFEHHVKIKKIVRFSIKTNDESCVFQSVLKCLPISSSFTSVFQLRQSVACINGPFPFEKLMDLAKLIELNILVVMNNGDKNGVPFFSFVHDAFVRFIILMWNNVETHTEPYCDSSSTFSWSKRKMIDFGLDNYFNLEVKSSPPKKSIRDFNIPTNNYQFMRMENDQEYVEVAFLGYISYAERCHRKQFNFELTSLKATSSHGMYHYNFVNDCNSIESDYVSSDDESVIWTSSNSVFENSFAQQKRLLERLTDDDCEKTITEVAIPPLPRLHAPEVVAVDNNLVQRRLLERLSNLSAEQTQRVEAALSPPHDESLLVETFKIPVTRRVIKCLGPRLWLNDEIVNYYMGLLQKWDKNLCNLDTTRRQSHFFNLFFMSQLLQEGEYKYANVKRY